MVSYGEQNFSAVWDTPQKRFFEFLNLNNFAKLIFYAKSNQNMYLGPRWS
jgi:hypothetical protein